MLKRALFFVLAPFAIYIAFYYAYERSEETRERRHAHRPVDIAERLLTLAKVGPDDTLVDLECGDGTLSVLAARKYRARSICIDTFPRRILDIRDRVRAEGLESLITVKQEGWKTADLSPATVVALFATTPWDRSIRGKLTKELRPGVRIVAWFRSLGAWEPAHAEMFQSTDEREPTSLMLWIADGKYRPTRFGEAPFRLQSPDHQVTKSPNS